MPEGPTNSHFALEKCGRACFWLTASVGPFAAHWQKGFRKRLCRVTTQLLGQSFFHRVEKAAA